MAFCLVTTEANLPEVHHVLLNTSKFKECALITSLCAERAARTSLPCNHADAPITITRLVENVFRNCAPEGTGLTFARGLSPFAIVCEGHSEAAKMHQLTRNAHAVESGSTTTPADVQALTFTDVRFPTEA